MGKLILISERTTSWHWSPDLSVLRVKGLACETRIWQPGRTGVLQTKLYSDYTENDQWLCGGVPGNEETHTTKEDRQVASAG